MAKTLRQFVKELKAELWEYSPKVTNYVRGTYRISNDWGLMCDVTRQDKSTFLLSWRNSASCSYNEDDVHRAAQWAITEHLAMCIQRPH